MKPEIIAAILRRGNFKCGWCAVALGVNGVKSVVCRLDSSEDDRSMVASCASCNEQFTRWWPYAEPYSVESAKRRLGQFGGHVFTGPFIDYLNSAARFDSTKAASPKRGLLTPFTTALARIEAQRNAPLDVRKSRVA